MKVIMTLPPRQFYRELPSALSSEDVSALKEKGVELAYYWYAAMPYEGYGYILFKKEGKPGWFLHDASHCSCYGPLDGIDEYADHWESLEELEREATAELRDEIAALIAAARRGQERTDLSGADLRNAQFGWAYLRGADLRGADLRGADLRCTDLREADLRGADLGGANLRSADLRGVSFENAKR